MRLPDWETRLCGLLDAARERPFALGAWDCALFGGAVVEALTGVDIAAPYRGRYSTVRGYKRALTAQGHRDIFGPFDTLGERVPLALLRRGDIVSDGSAVGMLWHGCALFVRPDAGFERVPLRAVLHGWRIG